MLNSVEPRLLTVKETAARMNVTVWCVRNWIWDGKLSYIPAGKKFLIDPGDLEKLVISLKRKERS
jgi:excisionase family DNA binding protein